MAELAIGLSKSVVVGAITKVQSAIEEDARIRQKVKHDLVFITLELEMIQSFLDDANQEMKNNLVRTWVKHIRQLAYDIEDSVENAVQLDSTYKPIFWRRMLPSFITLFTPPLPLDQAVEEIGRLKGRVEDVNNCYRRYNLINVDTASGSKPASFPKQPEPGETPYDILLAEARNATNWRHGAFGDLTQLITREELSLQVISVWGAGSDHGTTSIIRKSYDDLKICQIFAHRFWVKLMHPFSSSDFIRTMMAQFYANSGTQENKPIGVHVLTMMEAPQAHLFEEFKRLFRRDKYFIVLEGLSNMADWDAIKTLLPDMDNRSRIVVSTQQPEIATLCIGPSYRILELIRFPDQHSVCALFKVPGLPEASQISSYDHILIAKKEEAVDWTERYPLVGRESQINELRKYLAEECVNTKVMSVWGMAGVGKSSFVKHLYFDVMLHSGDISIDKYIWVDISYPFNLRGFCRSLLSDFDSEKDPIQECRQLLEQHKCLVVVDNLQSKKEWNTIQAELVPKSSRSIIIVITTEASMANHCANDEKLMFNVKGLEAAQAIDLFRKEVIRKNPSSSLKDSKYIYLTELISKCGGFPTVIAAIADLLVTKEVTWMNTVHSLNRRFMHHLETDPEFNSLRGLFHWMQSIILNPPDFLKPCIFYLSIFPRDSYIRRRRLLRRWIAEGYSKQSADTHVEENAEKFFSELVQLSIFQPVPQLASTDTRMVFYQVNGLIREYIISRQVEENLVFELSDDFALTTQSRGRHLIISRTWDRDRVVFESIDFSCLRSLTVFGKWRSFFISKNMKLLRVLDLEDAIGVNDFHLDNMVKLLPCLKFLSLRGCDKVCHLPCSLGDLRQLQTLDIRYTSISSLPESITKLDKLQYVRAGSKSDNLQYVRASTNFGSALTPTASSNSSPGLHMWCRRLAGVKVPIGIGKLTGLHTLGVINVAASGGKVFLKELKKLTQLRKLGVSGINSKNSKNFLYSFSRGDAHLESLSLQLDKDNQGCLDSIPLPLDNLQSLKLYGLNDKLPEWSERLSKLTKLDLDMATLTENTIEFLGKLPQLRILQVKQLQDGILHLGVAANGLEVDSYQQLKVFEVSCSRSSGMLELTFGSKTMKRLEVIKVDCSSGSLYYRLLGLNYLSELSQVLLKGTKDEELQADLQKQLLDHPRKPSVKLEDLARSS